MTNQEKAIKEKDRLSEIVSPILEALYKEFNDHKTCEYEFGCIIESITLWRELEKFIAQVREETLTEFLEIGSVWFEGTKYWNEFKARIKRVEK